MLRICFGMFFFYILQFFSFFTLHRSCLRWCWCADDLMNENFGIFLLRAPIAMKTHHFSLYNTMVQRFGPLLDFCRSLLLSLMSVNVFPRRFQIKALQSIMFAINKLTLINLWLLFYGFIIKNKEKGNQTYQMFFNFPKLVNTIKKWG